MPQQLAVGLALRQSIRSKEIVNMLHGFEMSVEYNKLLRTEAQIEQTVLERMNKHGGVYFPEDFVKKDTYFLQLTTLISQRTLLMESTYCMAPQWLSTRTQIQQTQHHK